MGNGVIISNFKITRVYSGRPLFTNGKAVVPFTDVEGGSNVCVTGVWCDVDHPIICSKSVTGIELYFPLASTYSGEQINIIIWGFREN